MTIVQNIFLPNNSKQGCQNAADSDRDVYYRSAVVVLHLAALADEITGPTGTARGIGGGVARIMECGHKARMKCLCELMNFSI